MKYDFNENFDRAMSEKWMYDSVVDGYKVMPMDVADMDLVSPVEVREAVASIARRREFGYPGYHPDYKTVLANWFDHWYGWRPDEATIRETPALVETLGLFVRDYIRDDEQAVLITPVYFNFQRTMTRNHRKYVECDLICGEGNHYEIDFEKLRALCADPKSRLVMFCNPHNPVGRNWTEAEEREVIKIAQETNTLLVTDEIHGDFTFEGSRYTPVLKVAENPKGILMLSSGGKIFNIGGIFSAFCVSGDPEILAFMDRVIDEFHWQPTAFAHEASYAGYKYGHDYKRQLLIHIRRMQKKFVDGVNAMPYPIKATLPEATYLVWLDFRDTGWTQRQIADFLVKEASLGFNQGDTFGKAGTGFVRVNCAVCEARIDEALRRLEHAFRHHDK